MEQHPFPIATSAEERDEVSEVLSGKLYLTNWRSGTDEAVLKRLGVTHVAAIGDEFVDEDGEDEGVAGVAYYTKAISDDDDQAGAMGAALVESSDFIRAALDGGGVCLVHCAAGVSRSSTVVLAYLLVHKSSTLRDALQRVWEERACTWPNDGFMSSLVELEMRLRGENSLTMEEYVRWGDYEPPPPPEEEEEEEGAAPTEGARAEGEPRQESGEEARASEAGESAQPRPLKPSGSSKGSANALRPALPRLQRHPTNIDAEMLAANVPKEASPEAKREAKRAEAAKSRMEARAKRFLPREERERLSASESEGATSGRLSRQSSRGSRRSRNVGSVSSGSSRDASARSLLGSQAWSSSSSVASAAGDGRASRALPARRYNALVPPTMKRGVSGSG